MAPIETLLPALAVPLAKIDKEWADALRLPPSTPAQVVGFFGVLVLGLVGFFALRLVYRISRRRSRPAPSPSEDRLEVLLARRGVRGELRTLLETISELAGETTASCVASIEVFDRGVEKLIARAALREPRDRLELLRGVRSLRRHLEFDHARPQEPLRSTRCLGVDQELILCCTNPHGEEEYFATTLFSNDEDTILLRLLPLGDQPQQRPFTAEVGTGIRVHFFRPEEGAYSFESRVTEYRRKGPGFLRIRHARTLRRCQRRNYTRVDLNEPVAFRWFPRRTTTSRRVVFGDPDEVFRDYTGVARNLSGGGMRVEVFGVQLELEDWLEVRMPFLPGNAKHLSCFARVTQVHTRTPERGDYGIEFESPLARLEIAVLNEVERRVRGVTSEA